MCEWFREHVCALLREHPHDVALRQDADNPPIRTEHEQRADLMLSERAHRGFEGRGGFDGKHIAALGGKNALDVHGSPPLTGSLRPTERRVNNARFAIEFRRVSRAIRPRDPKVAPRDQRSRRALVIDALGGAAVTIDYRPERSMPQGARQGWHRVGLAPSGFHKALRPVSALARRWERSNSERDRMRKMPEDRPTTPDHARIAKAGGKRRCRYPRRLGAISP